MFADLHVVADLHQVVELDPPADDGRIRLGAVDAGVGPDLHVVFDDHVAQLRNFVVSPLRVRSEAETVGPDDCAGMEDATAADAAAFVNFDPRVEDGAFADANSVADVNLGIELAAVADFRSGFDDREVAHVTILAQPDAFGYGGQAADPLFAGLRGVVELQQPQYAAAHVVHPHQRGTYRAGGDEVLAHQHYGCARRIEVFFVFGVGQVGQRSRLALLDRGDRADACPGVAGDFAPEQAGDHFSGKFHRFILKGICGCRCRGAETHRPSGRRRALRARCSTRCQPRARG